MKASFGSRNVLAAIGASERILGGFIRSVPVMGLQRI